MKTNQLKNTQKTNRSVLVKIVITAMLSAVAFVLFLFEFPIIPGASHLKLDLSDIPALLCSLVCGPVWGVATQLLKNVIELLVKGLGTQMGFGNMMDFIAGCMWILPFTLIFNALIKKEMKKPVAVTIAGIIAIAVRVVVGIGANYLIDPLFFKYFMNIVLDSKTLWAAIWSATAINAIKGVMLTIVAYPIVLGLLDKLKKFR